MQIPLGGVKLCVPRIFNGLPGNPTLTRRNAGCVFVVSHCYPSTVRMQACLKAALSHNAINNAASESGLPVWTKSSQGQDSRASLFIAWIWRLKSLLRGFVKVQVVVLDSSPLISLMVSVDAYS